MTKIEYYECPECEWEGPRDGWDEFDVDCDSCGGHPNYRCPECGWSVDPYIDGWEPLRTEGGDESDPYEGWRRHPVKLGTIYTRPKPALGGRGLSVEIAFEPTVTIEPGDTLHITYCLGGMVL